MNTLLAWLGRILAGVLSGAITDWRADQAREQKGRLEERDAANRQRTEWETRMAAARDAVAGGGDYAERVRERFSAGGGRGGA